MLSATRAVLPMTANVVDGYFDVKYHATASSTTKSRIGQSETMKREAQWDQNQLRSERMESRPRPERVDHLTVTDEVL